MEQKDENTIVKETESKIKKDFEIKKLIKAENTNY